jgi:tetratricopeptide (TPR) repeat protein
MLSTPRLEEWKWPTRIISCICASVFFSQLHASDASPPATTQTTQPPDTSPAAAASQPAGPDGDAIDLSSPEAAIRQALAYKQRGDVADALRCLDAAGIQFPKNEGLLNEYGLALVDSGRLDDGIGKYREAIGLNPKFVAAHLNLSNALFAQGNFKESAEQLQIAIKIDPRSFEAYMNSGVMLSRLKNYPAAARMFQVAAPLRPDSSLAHDDLGVTLAQQGFLAEAVDQFTEAVRLKPDFKEAREHLARARAEVDAKKQSGSCSLAATKSSSCDHESK